MKQFFKKLCHNWKNNKEKDMSSKSVVTPLSANSSGTIGVSSPPIGMTYSTCILPGYPVGTGTGYVINSGGTGAYTGMGGTGYVINSGGTVAYTGMGGTWTATSGPGSPGGFFTSNPLCITFNNAAGELVVKIYNDGTIEWGKNINVDEAAKAFARSIHLGMEQAAGIKEATKLRIRNSVFEELINIAKEKGSLTYEELTYLLDASKIVEKLKGIE